MSNIFEKVTQTVTYYKKTGYVLDFEPYYGYTLQEAIPYDPMWFKGLTKKNLSPTDNIGKQAIGVILKENETFRKQLDNVIEKNGLEEMTQYQYKMWKRQQKQKILSSKQGKRVVRA